MSNEQWYRLGKVIFWPVWFPTILVLFIVLGIPFWLIGNIVCMIFTYIRDGKAKGIDGHYL